jgi:hypothetical protein
VEQILSFDTDDDDECCISLLRFVSLASDEDLKKLCIQTDDDLG